MDTISNGTTPATPRTAAAATPATPRTAAAAVTGARHLRAGRNGQDAAAAWAEPGRGAVVVCDGCGSGASSEVGARLGAQLALGAIARELRAGGDATALWPAVRAAVGEALAALLAQLPGDRAQQLHDHLLFTLVAAAWDGDRAAVYALGDGAYAFDGAAPVVRGPFPDNQPPYLAYDLLGEPAAAHLAIAPPGCTAIAVATDGVAELGFDPLGARDRYLAHPDALRRRLVQLARGDERIAWDERRVERRPAALQDDGAVALLAWGPA